MRPHLSPGRCSPSTAAGLRNERFWDATVNGTVKKKLALVRVRQRGNNRRANMSTCDVCGNDYDKAFRITQAGRTMTFDSFECAIHAMAPACAHCGCKIVGHGVEAGGRMYCCAHCAQHQGGIRDRAA